MRATGKTKDEAAEAWNTWPGRYKRPNREAFVKANSNWRFPNPDQLRELREDISSGKDGADAILHGSTSLLDDGTFKVPWPRLMPFQGEVSDYSPLTVFLLRVRWAYAVEDVSNYETAISDLLKNMDRDGKAFEVFAAMANDRLSSLQLPLLEQRDLRGVNLAGLDLSGPPYEGICLRHFDLSFSELSMAELDGANLYSCKLLATAAVNTNLRYAILSSADLSHAKLSAIDLSGSDLSFVNFTDSLCHRATFDGAQMHQTNVSSAQLTDISMREQCRNGTSVLSLKKLKYDSKTRLTFRLPPSTTQMIPKDLLVSEPKPDETIGRVVGNAVALRPGLFGISVDLKAIGVFLYRKFWRRQSK